MVIKTEFSTTVGKNVDTAFNEFSISIGLIESAHKKNGGEYPSRIIKWDHKSIISFSDIDNRNSTTQTNFQLIEVEHLDHHSIEKTMR